MKFATTGAMVVFVAGLSVAISGQTPAPAPREQAPSTPRPTQALPPVPADAMTASVDDISNNPSKYYGKSVRVIEDVARILAPRIFTLDEETPLGMGKDVMVVSPKGITVREDERRRGSRHGPRVHVDRARKREVRLRPEAGMADGVQVPPGHLRDLGSAGQDLLTLIRGTSGGAAHSPRAPRRDVFQASRSGSITFSTTFPPSTLT